MEALIVVLLITVIILQIKRRGLMFSLLFNIYGADRVRLERSRHPMYGAGN
jgi:prolipoprotein diacylglyceryltransferase